MSKILQGSEMGETFDSVAGVPAVTELMYTLILAGISATALMGSY